MARLVNWHRRNEADVAATARPPHRKGMPRMQQQIKVIRTGVTVPATEEIILTAWESVTFPDGVRPALEAVYPLGDGLALLVFSGDLARANTVARQPQEVAP